MGKLSSCCKGQYRSGKNIEGTFYASVVETTKVFDIRGKHYYGDKAYNKKALELEGFFVFLKVFKVFW